MADITIAGWVRIPKSLLGDDWTRYYRAELTLKQRTFGRDEAPATIEVFREDDDALYVPREWYFANRSKVVDVDYDIEPGAPLSTCEVACRPRTAEQAQALEVMVAELTSGPCVGRIMRCPPGWGKTVVTIMILARLGVRFVVLVHKKFLARQWQRRFAEFAPAWRVGLVTGDKCEISGDGAICVIQSLYSRGIKTPGGYPDALWRFPGVVVVDEQHRIGAETFGPTVPLFPAAKRLGVSAEIDRIDGLADVFLWQLGPVAFEGTTRELAARIFVRRLGLTLPPDVPRARASTWVARNAQFNAIMQRDLLAAVDAGRKVLVLGDRVEHLYDIRAFLTAARPTCTSAPYCGQWPSESADEHVNRCSALRLSLQAQADAEVAAIEAEDIPFAEKVQRRRAVRARAKADYDKAKARRRKTVKEADLEAGEAAQVLFATAIMVEEGLDIPALDTMLLIVQLSDLVQAAGRVLRPAPGKKPPFIIDYDTGLAQFASSVKARARLYRELGWEVTEK